jgi:hypothetical protein
MSFITLQLSNPVAAFAHLSLLPSARQCSDISGETRAVEKDVKIVRER